jgi:hypothetical protein
MTIKVGVGGFEQKRASKTLKQKAQETGFVAACARILLRWFDARFAAFFAEEDSHLLKIAQRATTSEGLESVCSRARPGSAAQKLALERLDDLQRKQILQRLANLRLANLAESLTAKELELAREASTREELEETLLMVRPDSDAQKLVLQKLASAGWFTLLPRRWS